MLVGHSDAVLTVAVSVTNKSHVLSGSKDCNLILWDLHNGEEIHTLAGHLGAVTCVRVSADGEMILFPSLVTCDLSNIYDNKKVQPLSRVAMIKH